MPSGEALKAAAAHQSAAMALASSATTGVRRGLYRFATHEEANAHAEAALARAMAEILRARGLTR